VGGNLHGLVKIDKENKAHLFFDVGKPFAAIREEKLGQFWWYGRWGAYPV